MKDFKLEYPPFILFQKIFQPGGTGLVVWHHLPVEPDRRPAGLPSHSIIQSAKISKTSVSYLTRYHSKRLLNGWNIQYLR
jgi:hypothetical protein